MRRAKTPPIHLMLRETNRTYCGRRTSRVMLGNIHVVNCPACRRTWLRAQLRAHLAWMDEMTRDAPSRRGGR
jgi:hypothetical protein